MAPWPAPHYLSVQPLIGPFDRWSGVVLVLQPPAPSRYTSKPMPKFIFCPRAPIIFSGRIRDFAQGLLKFSGDTGCGVSASGFQMSRGPVAAEFFMKCRAQPLQTRRPLGIQTNCSAAAVFQRRMEQVIFVCFVRIQPAKDTN